MNYIFFSSTGLINGNEISSDRTEVSTLKGSDLTLSCSYSSSGSPTLQWYRQNPNLAPQHLFSIYIVEKNETSDIDSRLSGRMTKDKVFLEISSAEVSDSALYYCALRPTVNHKHTSSYKNLRGVCFFCLTGLIDGNDVTSDRTEVSAVEGSDLTLSCSYSYLGLATLFWYQQFPKSTPEHLLTIVTAGKNETSGIYPRLSGKKTADKVFLKISSAKVSDSALYYCALRPTYPNKEPQYLLRKGARSESSEHTSAKRFKSSTSQSSTELVIEELTLADTALYYCALRVLTQCYKVSKKFNKNSWGCNVFHASRDQNHFLF
ncbi:hypothetical protein ACEWY4_007075 [Coilia grayii]|uniref:Ig-like domain-containing protein n=1 Tax=Coilia grayii TaxID=363190 RepID=A0ABD1KFK9_9TELE